MDQFMGGYCKNWKFCFFINTVGQKPGSIFQWEGMGVHFRMQGENIPEISGVPFSGKFDGAFLHSPDPAEILGGL